MESRVRAARSPWNTLVQAQVKAGDLNLSRWLARAMLIENAVMAGYVVCWAGLAAALAAVPGVRALYPGTDFAYSLMPWLGLSGLYFRFRTQAYKK